MHAHTKPMILCTHAGLALYNPSASLVLHYLSSFHTAPADLGLHCLSAFVYFGEVLLNPGLAYVQQLVYHDGQSQPSRPIFNQNSLAFLL